jgi:nucleoside-diphosphate-sugar epimerase
MAGPMKLVVLGLGYSASAFVAAGAGRFSSVVATVRSAASAARAGATGAEVLALDDPATGPRLLTAIAGADAMLVSVPAEAGGDPLLPGLAAAISAAPNLRWIGYLSTVGVYGDHGGAWVDERSALNATSQRGLARIAAERGWLDLGAASGKAVQVFRLAGIYGPGRNQLQSVADGTARRIIKPGQVFSRIHVDDIAGACLASLDRPAPGTVYNVADHEPAPPQDVIAFAAQPARPARATGRAFRDGGSLAHGALVLHGSAPRLECAPHHGAGLCLPPSDLSRRSRRAVR